MSATPIGPGRPADTVTHLLPGPGLHPSALSEKREREQRERERGVPLDRERDRRSSNASVHDSPGSIRREREQQERQATMERERQERYAQQRERELREQELREQELRRERRAKREMQMMREQEAQMQMQVREQEREREQRERERMREREQRERDQRDQDFRMHAHEMMGMSVGLGLGAGMSMSAAERERAEREERDREWLQKAQQQMEGRGGSRQHQHQHQMQHPPPPPPPPMQTMGPPLGHGQGQVWPRFVTPSGPSPEEERMLQEREMQRRGMEDVRMRELEWESDKVERPSARSGKSRTNAKDRDREDRTKDGQREDRRRSSARDKEREREKLEMEMQQEREREHRLRERELALQKEAQYELMERERIQRQRDLADMETIRAVRAREEQMQQMQAQGQIHGAPQQQHIHHVHPHHHQHPSAPGSQVVPQHLKGPSGKQGGMGPGPMPQDLPPQYQHERDRDFRQGPSKGVPHNQMGIPPPHLAQGMPMPHPMPPGPHMRQHPPPDMYPPPPGAHIGYPGRRPSPPPGHGQPVAMINPAYMFPRSSSPSSPPVFLTRNLGTFVFPRTPFPFFDFPAPTNESGAPSEPLDIRATIYVPSRFIPLTRPARPRIWGGALIPAVPPLTGAQRALCQQFTPGNSQFGRPWPDEVREGRRVYTDDSDLFLCALHAGWVSWSAARRARREGRDLVMEVRLTREARYIGGYGSPLRAREREQERERGEEELGSEDDGSSLLSSGWGNGHDGAGVEVLSAEFVQPGVAHSFGLRSRSQRLLEYAERRCALGCAPKLSRKRGRLHGPAFADGESAVQLRLDQADEELSATRVMVFGTDSSWPEIGFKYHPDALKSILFPQSTSEGRPSKRRKLAASADNAASDTPPPDSSSDAELVPQRAVVVETLWESFLISQRGQITSGESGDAEPESDKENTSASADGSARRYVIALLTNAGGTAGKLPRKAVTTAAKTGEGTCERKPVPEPEGDGTSASAPQLDTAPGRAEKVSKDSGSSAPSTDPAPSASAPQPLERAQSKASDESADDADDADGNGPIQILHHDLGEENLEFLEDGIHVLSSEVVNGMRKGWKLEAQQWKWVQVGVTS
ncbi:hypothetical protein C8T65DRAFT_82035 [Cerioporus squamosus]|nr:hypothetical protein C8T65DRAFT_82035 [Cerioporus squamosus]